MFPYLSDLTNYLFGLNFTFPLPMFGFMVAIAFIAGNYVWTLEMKRKEREGLLLATTKKVIVGEKASVNELVTNGLFGFLVGYKLLGVILNYSEIVSKHEGLPDYILSTQGNIFGGLLIGGVMAYLKYRDAEKKRLPEPKEVEETVHPFQEVGPMTFVAAIAGIIGAKLFDAIEDIDRLVADPIEVIFSGSGLSIYGGLIIGGGSVIYYAYKKGLKVVHVVDACAPTLMLAYGIGRIGCQLSGDGDWGIPNDLPMPDAISFLPEWMWKFDYLGNISGIDLGEVGRPVLVDGMTYTGNAWPTPFYETVMSFIIFGILWGVRNKIKVAGVMFSVYLMFNGVERFFIEKIRINSNYNIFGIEATQAEIIAVLLFIMGAVGVWYFTKKSKSSV
ncbi:MAG: prolipoprotein diacylglyceryl transferase [Vicingaceae bacterium]|nr:prolipoprotein diacylglyceryl transferase [Vicingaceae bacterium]